MATNLQKLIQVLNPSMSESEIALAERIFHGKRRLLPHGALPHADYSLPKATSEDTEHSIAVFRIIEKMIELCYKSGYQGLASTQLGMRYPIIVIRIHDGTFISYTHPEFRARGQKTLTVLDGCGSLIPHHGTNSMYFAKYPQQFEATYTNPFEYKTKTVKLQLPQDNLWDIHTRVVYLHEVRNLMGLTAANGFLVNFSDLTQKDLELADQLIQLFLRKETVEKLYKRVENPQKAGALLVEYLREIRHFGGTHVTIPGTPNQPRYVETMKIIPALKELVASF